MLKEDIDREFIEYYMANLKDFEEADRRREKEEALERAKIVKGLKNFLLIMGGLLSLNILSAIANYEPLVEAPPPDPQIYRQYIERQKAQQVVTKTLPSNFYTKPLELVAKDGRRYELDMSPEEFLQYYDIDIEDLKEYLGDELR